MGILDWFRNVGNSETSGVTVGGSIFNKRSIVAKESLEIPSVYSAIELISNTVSSLEVKFYKEDDTGVSEVKDDPRLFCFNDEPNALMTSVELKKAIIKDYLLYGSAYIYVDNKDRDIKLTYVPTRKISILENDTDPLNPQIRLQIGGKIYYPHEFIILTKTTETGGFSSVLDLNAIIGKLSQL